VIRLGIAETEIEKRRVRDLPQIQTADGEREHPDADQPS